MTTFDEMVKIVQIVASGAVVLALIFTGLTFRRVGKTEQIKMAEGTYKDLKELEKELPELPPDVTTGDADSKAKTHWNSRLFNTLEWYSFLVNKEQIKDEAIIKYFKDAIVDYFENNFQNEATEEQITDTDEYPEFKQLYKEFKNGKFESLARKDGTG
jgi:hypothetical protein